MLVTFDCIWTVFFLNLGIVTSMHFCFVQFGSNFSYPKGRHLSHSLLERERLQIAKSPQKLFLFKKTTWLKSWQITLFGENFPDKSVYFEKIFYLFYSRRNFVYINKFIVLFRFVSTIIRETWLTFSVYQEDNDQWRIYKDNGWPRMD